ncbi:hypothetical protein CUMW_109200 [Citrus unshiu]|nr:hypothetical protein CUMW_109200 [Citrus unshiu]GAY48088.1 hypothetical protein CUMW_109200 [Citrus unshiu]
MNSSKCHLAKARFVVGHQLDQLGMNSLALRLRINENRLENGSSALFGTSWISLGPLGREMLSESKLKDLLHRLRISSLRLMKTNWDWMLWVMSLGGSRISEVDVNMPNGCSIAMSNIQAMQKADNIEVIQTYDLSFHFNVVLVSCNLENILKEPISPSLRVENAKGCGEMQEQKLATVQHIVGIHPAILDMLEGK